MKIKFLLGLLIFTQPISAQNFVEASPSDQFEGVYYFGAVAFGDIDGDNDLDVIMNGRSANDPITKMYTNDGMGNFSEVMDIPFEDYFQGSVSFADVDGDNDQDIFITGVWGGKARLYLNDGVGNFSEKVDTPFGEVSYSSVAFADFDDDGDLDLFYAGRRFDFSPTSRMFTNDGMGNFSEVSNTPFENVRRSSMDFADIDGDNDLDILLTGENSSNSTTSKLYTNDGTGNFSLVSNTPFEAVQRGSVAFADVDGDDDQDVLITGSGISKLYTNDGAGNFSEMMGTPFHGTLSSAIAFADVDGDNDKDVIITGNGISKLYINDGAGNFSELMGTSFDGTNNGSVAFADVDGDNDPDVLITGMDEVTDMPISKLYINIGETVSTGNSSFRMSDDLKTFPNPTIYNKLNIIYDSSENGLVTIKVYDLNGQLKSSKNEFSRIGEQIFSIDVASFSSGSYFVQLDNGQKMEVQKFIVD